MSRRSSFLTVVVLLFCNIFLLVSAEGAVRVLAAYGVVRIEHFPTSSPSERFLGDIREDVGVWHYPDRSVIHESPCFRAEYSSNSYGARDRERRIESQGRPRVVVLGDSFVEGYGVSAGERMTDIAEQITGVEFLNFGVSGNFGSIQQWLLYENLASKFEHTDVAIFLLPANDFDDNNPGNSSSRRYRPYLRRDDSGTLQTYYPVSFENREQPAALGRGRYLRRVLYNNIYLLNLVRQAGQAIENSKAKNRLEILVERHQGSDYDSYSSEDLEKLLFSYEKIIRNAVEKDVVIYVIPTRSDFISYRTDGYNFKLIKALSAFSSQFENVRVVDLLPLFAAYAEKEGVGFDDFLHRCDDHWGPSGNQLAGKILAKILEF